MANPAVPNSILLRVRRLQGFTILWMAIEAGVSLAAAWKAKSPALLAFGGDSAIEWFSALVVLWQFRTIPSRPPSAKTAAKASGALLFILAIYIAVISVRALLGYATPRPSLLGIGILLTASAVMPWLAREKRKLSAITGSAALRADAAESAVCGYLAVIALLGLAANALWNIHWADSMVALAIIPFIIHEGWEAMKDKSCGCD